jgi:hypothetical protein
MQDEAASTCLSSNHQAGVPLCCQTSHGALLTVLSQKMLLLPNLAGVRRAGLLWMPCWVMSCMPVEQACNLCWCYPHGALTDNVVVCVMHVEVKGLLVLFGCSVGSCRFNVLLVLLLSNNVGVRHARHAGLLRMQYWVMSRMPVQHLSSWCSHKHC